MRPSRAGGCFGAAAAVWHPGQNCYVSGKWRGRCSQASVIEKRPCGGNPCFACADCRSAIAQRPTVTGQVVNPGEPQEFAAAIEDQMATVKHTGDTLGIKPSP